MSWMGKRNAAKRDAQRVKDTADIVAEGWWPPVTEHDARMVTGEDGCNLPNHDHSRELTDAEVDAALYSRDTRLDAGIVAEADSQAAGPDAQRLSRRFLASLREGDIDNARLQITALADLAASTDETPDGPRDRAARELEAYQSMADRFHQGEPARSAGEAEMFEFFRESCPDQDREAE